MSDQRTLCDLDKKYIKQHLDDVMDMIINPKYVCLKCARSANRKEFLCKPTKLRRS
jgi:hypothetical protein